MSGKKKRSNPSALDIAHFFGTPSYELAVVVHRETEAQRTIEALEFRAKHGDQPQPTNALMALASTEPYDLSGYRPWGEYAKSFDVLERCREELGGSPGDVAKRIALELQPENSEVIFWMANWLLALDEAFDSKAEMQELTATLEKSRRENSVKGAESMHERQYGKAKRFVQAEWKTLKPAFEGNKSAFARQYVPKVSSQFDLIITHKTIATSWLKGL